MEGNLGSKCTTEGQEFYLESVFKHSPHYGKSAEQKGEGGLEMRHCCQQPETNSHLLWECPMARNVWAILKGRVQKCSNQVQEFFHLFRMPKDKLTMKELEQWATTSWAIWNARNRYYFEKVQRQPRTIMDHATGLLEDY